MKELNNHVLTSNDLEAEMHRAEASERPATEIELTRLLKRRRKFLFGAAVWGALLGLGIAVLIPAHYESTVRLMPPEQQSGSGLATLLAALSGKGGGGLGAAAASLLGGKSSGSLVADVLRSRTIQDHIVQQFELQKAYRKKYVQDARKRLNNRTTVNEDKKSGIITLTVEDTDRARAQKMADAYTHELNALLAQVSTSTARRQRVFLEGRLQVVKQDLERAEKAFAQFSSTNATLDIKEQTKAMVTAGAELQGQLIAGQAQLQSLEQLYTPENVHVRAARARINELQRQLRQFSGTQSEAGGDNVYPPLRKIPVLGVRWAELYRDVQIQQTVFELLTEQFELAKVEEAKEIATVSVIDPADWPEKKSWPPRGIIAVSIFLLTVISAIAWLIFGRWWSFLDDNHRFRRFVRTVLGNADEVTAYQQASSARRQ